MSPSDDADMPAATHGSDDASELARATGSDDAVARLRDRLASIDDVPVAERVAVFEGANATLTAALAELDEV